MGNFGYGRHALTATFIFPSLYFRAKRHSKPPARLQHSDALIIIICLLLSGNIHPCPGPFNIKMELEDSIIADTIHTTTVLQVRTCCSELLFDYTQPTNLACSGSAGGAMSGVPVWGVGAGVEAESDDHKK